MKSIEDCRMLILYIKNELNFYLDHKLNNMLYNN